MAVQVYGVNHIAIEVDDAEKAAAFYRDVFGLEMLRGGEGAVWCKLGEHQFLAIFEVEQLHPDRVKHFGIMVRDEEQINEVRDKLTKKYGLSLHPDFRCDFRDPWGNRIQVGDLHDESLVWLLPYREVQQSGISFTSSSGKETHR
jgi:catechol 2,3-dioxygenase-like lactoylglutathione lyase family enzyme